VNGSEFYQRSAVGTSDRPYQTTPGRNKKTALKQSGFLKMIALRFMALDYH